MGQKIDPRSVRLGINKNWDSIWYSDEKDYVKFSMEDRLARQFISKKLEAAGVDTIMIKRSLNKVFVEIVVARPGVVIGRGGSGIEDMKKEMNKIFKTDVDLKIIEVKNPEISARLIAQNIKAQLVRRIVPKFAMSKEVEKVKLSSAKVKGIRIWVSGRIKGTEIARTEKIQWGTVPLATLRADIDFAKDIAQVPNAGTHGIKVWVYRGEKSKMDELTD
jgi:small subunit ribosomal protein S3